MDHSPGTLVLPERRSELSLIEYVRCLLPKACASGDSPCGFREDPDESGRRISFVELQILPLFEGTFYFGSLSGYRTSQSLPEAEKTAYTIIDMRRAEVGREQACLCYCGRIGWMS